MKKIEAIALDVVDVDGLGRFTLGSSRKDLNETQLKKYIEVFRVFFAKNISSRLQNYSDQNIKVIGSKKIGDNYVLVNSKMISKCNFMCFNNVTLKKVHILVIFVNLRNFVIYVSTILCQIKMPKYFDFVYYGNLFLFTLFLRL